MVCLLHPRPILLEYGVWDQVRVDQGKEWVLMLFVQEQLAHLRNDISKAPHRQTTSKLVCSTITDSGLKLLPLPPYTEPHC